MAKLVCIDHKRRVVVLPSGRQYHRAGDGSECGSELKIGSVRGDWLVLQKIGFYKKH